MLKHHTTLVFTLLALLVVVTLFVWSLVYASSPRGVLTVTFLDVGQGDAIFIETPSGNQVLVDAGKGRSVLRGLGSHMSPGDRTINAVIATHPDLDHIGGLPEVFERYDIGMFLEPGVDDDGADNTALQEAVLREGLEPIYARTGTTLMLDEGVSLTFLFPESDTREFEANTASIVARLAYGETSFLLTGDSPVSIERYLVGRYGAGLASNVLKLGHHGSDTSTSPEFLGAVSPQYGVVSAGCDNPYGHPHQSVTERLVQSDVTVFTTCDTGDIVFESDGRGIVVRP